MCLITAQWNEAATFGETEGSSLLPPVSPPPHLCFPSFKQRSGVTRCWDMCYEKRLWESMPVLGIFPNTNWPPCTNWYILCIATAACTLFAEVFVSFTGPFYNMTPEERIDADHRSVYVGNVSLVCPLLPVDVCSFSSYTSDLMKFLKIPGRLWCYCRWTGDPFQWLRPC